MPRRPVKGRPPSTPAKGPSYLGVVAYSKTAELVGPDGARIGPGKCLRPDRTPRRQLATSSEEAVELDVFGADHEDDEVLTEEELEEDDDTG